MCRVFKLVGIIVMIVGLVGCDYEGPELVPAAEIARLHVLQTATAEAVYRQDEAARMAAAQAAVEATATAETLRATATAQAVQATATAQARDEERQDIVFQATATAMAVQAQADQARIAQEMRREEMRTRRDEITYPIRAYGPWLLVAVGMVAFVWGFYTVLRGLEVQLRAVRDGNGDVSFVVVQEQRRRVAVVNPRRALGPALVFDGEVRQPQLIADDVQERVTARDQSVALARASAAASQASQPGTEITPGAFYGVRVVDPDRVRAWLRDVRAQVLQRALTMEVGNDTGAD